MTALILAGGSNRRYPALKPFIEIEGEIIIERQLRVLLYLFDQVMLSTNLPEFYFKFGLPMVGDIGSSSGPLSGILSGLLNSSENKLFVVACDMPFIKKELIELILSKKDEASVVLCTYNRKLHPLIGLYDRSLISKIQKYIEQRNYRVIDFIKELDICIIDEDEIKKVDPDGCSFVNINTPEDLKKIIGGRICLD
jgi:molybdopterin-guanine dinucleotide biosynthesis protein A